MSERQYMNENVQKKRKPENNEPDAAPEVNDLVKLQGVVGNQGVQRLLAQRKLVITDGVFSMDGDLGSLPDLCAVAEEFGAIMMVDDAHASGVFGKHGRGTVDHFSCHGRVDIQVGTLSKAIGALGGYVAGTKDFIEFLYHRARPFLFSTSHPPAVAAACIAAIDVLMEEPQIIDRLWENTRFFKSGLERLGFNTGASESPITPVIAGDGARAMKLSDRLFEEGVFAQGIAYLQRATFAGTHRVAQLMEKVQLKSRIKNWIRRRKLRAR